MTRNIVQSAMLAVILLFAASVSFAADAKAPAAVGAKSLSKAKAADQEAKAKKAKAAAKVKLVDINSAGRTELKTLPGITDTEADKIIAGRPYLSKANLVTQNVLPRKTYEGLKARVIARQNQAAAAKLEAKQKAR
jgi:DNA uptake protein ComE-like DNA-binding protein